MKFDYGKLRELMRDKNITQSDLARVTGLSERSISLKFTGKIYWKQNEIYSVANILGIPKESVCEYFFTPKVLNMRTTE